MLGGGNEGWPWGQTDTGNCLAAIPNFAYHLGIPVHSESLSQVFRCMIVSGDGSQCVFEGNALDTCVYECGDCGALKAR